MEMKMAEFFFLGFLILGEGCRTRTEDKLQSSPKDGLFFLTEEDLPKKDVPAMRLDTMDFRISGFRVGTQNFLRYDTPVLTFDSPGEDVSYVEIARCPADEVIFGGQDSIEAADVGAYDGFGETEIYQRNNFWNAILNNASCKILAQNHQNNQFYDLSAPSGNYRYYIRSCVFQDRLYVNPGMTNEPCTRQVIRSSAYQLKTSRSEVEQADWENWQKLQGEIAARIEHLRELTIRLNKALKKCQDQYKVALSSKDQMQKNREIISGTVSGGGALGATIITIAAAKNVEWDQRSKAFASLGGILSAQALSAFVGSIYESSSATVGVIPREAPLCDQKSEQELANDLNAEDEFCVCAQILPIKLEQRRLADELKTRWSIQETLSKKLGVQNGKNN